MNFLQTYRKQLLVLAGLLGTWYLLGLMHATFGPLTTILFLTALAGACYASFHYGTQHALARQPLPAETAVSPEEPTATGPDPESMALIASLQTQLEHERAIVAAMTESFSPEHLSEEGLR